MDSFYYSILVFLLGALSIYYIIKNDERRQREAKEILKPYSNMLEEYNG